MFARKGFIIKSKHGLFLESVRINFGVNVNIWLKTPEGAKRFYSRKSAFSFSKKYGIECTVYELYDLGSHFAIV